MTTLDHPTDRRAAIMEAARQAAADHAAAERRKHEADANAAIDQVLPLVAELLESYGVDPTTGIASGACSDPTHALAWITTAAGFDFEVVRNDHYQPGRLDCWLLHPETGSPVVKLRPGITWELVACELVRTSVDNLDAPADPEPRDHPADRLVDALHDLIDGRLATAEGGF